jgi:hypothetical protein
MPDHPATPIPADPRNVNLEDEREIAYWLARFGCQRGALERAVRAVGSNLSKVKEHITRNHVG